jgi:Down syndrome cell adhesion molecule-like protein 1
MIGQYVTAHGDVIAHVNITHVMVEDGGEYACSVENRAGKTTHSARLNVYGLPYIRLIPKVTAVAGESLHLKCPVAGYPIEEVHWERGGRELPEDIRQKVQPDGSLVIAPVQKKDDSGVYTCWARNKQGHSARRSGEVSVIGWLKAIFFLDFLTDLFSSKRRIKENFRIIFTIINFNFQFRPK